MSTCLFGHELVDLRKDLRIKGKEGSTGKRLSSLLMDVLVLNDVSSHFFQELDPSLKPQKNMYIKEML